MPTIIPFDTGWTIILRLIDKLMYCILLLSWILQDIVLPCLQSTKDYVCNVVLPHFFDWKYTPIARKHKNRDKTNHGARKFSMKLRNSKNQVTMNAILSLEDIIADIHSCVTSRRRPVKDPSKCKYDITAGFECED